MGSFENAPNPGEKAEEMTNNLALRLMNVINWRYPLIQYTNSSQFEHAPQNRCDINATSVQRLSEGKKQ